MSVGLLFHVIATLLALFVLIGLYVPPQTVQVELLVLFSLAGLAVGGFGLLMAGLAWILRRFEMDRKE